MPIFIPNPGLLDASADLLDRTRIKGICGRSELRGLIGQVAATHLLSVTDVSCEPQNAFSIHRSCRLHLHFDDIEDPNVGSAPSMTDIMAALRWYRMLPSHARVVVACEGGVCRSTSLALGLIADEFGIESPADLRLVLAALRPSALPNSLVVRHFDTLLGLGGALCRLSDEISDNRVLKLLD